MNKSYLLSLFFLFLYHTTTYSQDVSTPVQPDGIGTKIFFEKAYVFTDRGYYSPGEDIWYTAFLFNGQTGLLTSTSSNLYVEIISPSSELVERKIIRISNGVGKGDFKLGDSVLAGKYRFRAYTNWMLNFGKTFVFEKEVTVLSSSLQNSAAQLAEPGAASRGKGKMAEKITFFPEGGSMIEGVPGIVAFKAESNLGKGLPITGAIETEDGTVITQLNTSFNGMGRFLLQPEAGKTYRAKGKYSNGTSFDELLPKAFPTGYGLYVKQTDSVFIINIKTNERTFTALDKKEMLIAIRSKGKTSKLARVLLTDLQVSFQIPKAGIPAGISSLTLYDESGKPQCERLLNIEDTQRANLRITTNKQVYQPKEKVIIDVKAANEQGTPVKASVVFAAIDASLIPEDLQGNIVSFLNLQSEIKGDIENAALYFDERNPNRNAQLDLLLLCAGWRDFVWKHLAENPIRITRHAEQGLTVSGRVLNKLGDKPVANANITLSASSARGNKLFITKSDSTGRFYVDGVEFYGYQPIKITSVDNKAQKMGYLLVDTSGMEEYPTMDRYPTLGDTTNFSKIVSTIQKRNEYKLTQHLSDTIRLNDVTIKSSKNSLVLRDVVLNDFGYKEDEFTISASDRDYTDLRHFLTHRLNYNTGIVNPGIRKDAADNFDYKPNFPRLIVNGREMPYTDEDPPELIQDYIDVYYGLRMDKVKYVKAKRMVGMDQNTGKSKEVSVLYLTVDIDAIRGSQVGVIQRELQGYYEARIFYEPQYISPNTRSDYRTTIHWQPLITTNENGEATITYYNATPKSKIRVVAEGITEQGKPVSVIGEYEVK